MDYNSSVWCTGSLRKAKVISRYDFFLLHQYIQLEIKDNIKVQEHCCLEARSLNNLNSALQTLLFASNEQDSSKIF